MKSNTCTRRSPPNKKYISIYERSIGSIFSNWKKEEKRKRFFIHISIGEMQEIILSHGFNLPYKIKIVSGKRHNSSKPVYYKTQEFLISTCTWLKFISNLILSYWLLLKELHPSHFLTHNFFVCIIIYIYPCPAHCLNNNTSLKLIKFLFELYWTIYFSLTVLNNYAIIYCKKKNNLQEQF